jgi:hypothetical protein
VKVFLWWKCCGPDKSDGGTKKQTDERNCQCFANMSATPAGKRIVNNVWHLYDAKDQVVGRLASQLVRVLTGKHKPTYQPNAVNGDNVIVINAAQVRVGFHACCFVFCLIYSWLRCISLHS